MTKGAPGVALEAALEAGKLPDNAAVNLRRWLELDAFAEFREELTGLLTAGEWAALDSAFREVLPFGTAGRRGTEGVGTNRINNRTIGETAAGLADCVRLAYPDEAVSCVVGYDARRNSRAYGELCAGILAARGVKVHLFEGPTATPMLAFMVLHLKADCGLMITASHNPPEYNGIKAYWRHGGQVVPPYDQGIIDAAQQLGDAPIEAMDLAQATSQGLVTIVGEPEEAAYQDYVAGQSIGTQREAKLVYSPLQGVGMRCVMPVLERAGFSDVQVVQAQAEPSSEFEAVADQIANPEVPKAMGEVLALCRELDADAGIASDPDADRIGYVARDREAEGGYRFFTGNQIGVLVTWHVCHQRHRTKQMPARPVLLKTEVTTELITRIAADHGVEVIGDLPVGFRWMGETLDVSVDDSRLVVAIEESHGVNCGGRVRDKDAASAALALAELTASLKASGQTAGELLDSLYRRYGVHLEYLHNEVMAERRDMVALLSNLRRHPPKSVEGLPVISIEDRLSGCYKDRNTGQSIVEDFLIFELGAGKHLSSVRLAMRPSGTEPKLKIYAMGCRELAPGESLKRVKTSAAKLLSQLPAKLLARAKQR